MSLESNEREEGPFYDMPPVVYPFAVAGLILILCLGGTWLKGEFGDSRVLAHEGWPQELLTSPKEVPHSPWDVRTKVFWNLSRTPRKDDLDLMSDVTLGHALKWTGAQTGIRVLRVEQDWDAGTSEYRSDSIYSGVRESLVFVVTIHYIEEVK